MNAPRIFAETDDWALLVKPHGMPTAPLAEGEKGTLLGWFLETRPDAGLVTGKKPVERGLIHRLDTGTEGFVLVARTQEGFDALSASQGAGLMRKTYFAFCVTLTGRELPARESLPLAIRSRFRPWGPKGREVRPLFPSMRGYEEAKGDYETIVERAETCMEGEFTGITCSLSKGYRHQVRAHLAWLGFPIAFDPLYGPRGARPDSCLQDTGLPLQLYAPGISFPDPASGRTVSFSLPLPDRTSP